MVGIYSNVCSHSNWQDNRKIFDVRSLLKSIGTSILILTKPFCYWLLSCHWLRWLSHLDTQLGILRTSTWSRQTIAITIGSPHGITCSGANYAIRKLWKKPSKSSAGYVTSINWSAISTVRIFCSSSVWKQFSFFNIWLTSKIGASTSPAAAIYTNDEVVTQEYATDEVVTQEYTSDEVVTQEYGHKGDGIREDSESSLDKCQLSISRSQVSVLGRVEGKETVMHQTYLSINFCLHCYCRSGPHMRVPLLCIRLLE